ncbi:hypothetical protein [Nocardia sp. XZ_19_369]|uniref:hypothetical protein n=1 Tax=Nocardia sp. XZ_19_369 TaxID=2769487 RepID=UPI001E64B8B5|nr:hypothetical protein [Nocardia sp. XZ_19_369]
MGKRSRTPRKRPAHNGQGTHVTIGGTRARTPQEMAIVAQASEGDRQWFDANPGARHRVRAAVAGEFDAEIDPSECPPGYHSVIAVEQIAPGHRLKTPLAYVPILPGHSEPTEDQFALVWGDYLYWRKNNGLPGYRADELRQHLRGATPSIASITTAGFAMVDRPIPDTIRFRPPTHQ